MRSRAARALALAAALLCSGPQLGLGAGAVPSTARLPATTVDRPPPAARDTTAVLAGRVILARTGGPARAARVELLRRDRTTLTDSLGRFRFQGLAPGRDTLRVSRLGGRTRTRPVRLEAGAVTRVEVTVEPEVVELGGLEVTVEGPEATQLRRLAERIEKGVGSYITRDDLEEHEGRLSFAFRGVLGTRVAYAGRGGFRVLMTTGRGSCAPELFVNGIRQPGVPIDAYEPHEVAAIEIYESDLVPGRFRTIQARECGAVLIWTRSFVR